MVAVALDDEREERVRRSEGSGFTDLQRLIALSDGVFAIALTLLAVQLTVPELTVAPLQSELTTRLLGLYPKVLSYVIAFAVVALYWTGHRRTFKHIRRSDSWLTLLNLGLLLCVTFQPFPTAVLGSYGNQTAAPVLFACTLALTGLFTSGIWLYAALGHRLIARTVSSRLILHLALRGASAPLVFLISIPIAFINPTGSELAWAFIFVVQFGLRRVFGEL